MRLKHYRLRQLRVPGDFVPFLHIYWYSVGVSSIFTRLSRDMLDSGINSVDLLAFMPFRIHNFFILLMNIMFFGAGQFPVNLLRTLSNKNFNWRLATTVSKELYKKQTEITAHTFASEHKKDIILFESADLLSQWNAYTPQDTDIGIVCNFPYMIPPQIIDSFKRGMLVIHPSLLPKFRGAAPIQRCLMAGDKETGVSFVKISKNKFDAGALVYQTKTDIGYKDRYPELSEKLSQSAATALGEILQNYDQLVAEAKPQDESLATKAPKIKQEESIVQFQTQSAAQVIQNFKGLYQTKFDLRATFRDKVILFDQLEFPKAKVFKLQKQIQELEDVTKIEGIQPKQIVRLTPKAKHLMVRCSDTFIKLVSFRYQNRNLVQQGSTLLDGVPAEITHQFD